MNNNDDNDNDDNEYDDEISLMQAGFKRVDRFCRKLFYRDIVPFTSCSLKKKKKNPLK